MQTAFERWLLRNFGVEGRALAAQLTGRALRAILGIFTLAGTVAFIAVTFRNIAPPLALNLWLCAMTVAISAPLVLTIAFAIHGPASERALRPYAVIARAVSFALSALIAASVWILLPHAGPPLQFVMLVLYVTFVAMMLGADASPALMIEQLGVMASAIAFVLVYRLPYAVPLAIVLGAVAVSLVGLHRMLYRSTQGAVAARAAAERANAALQIALADAAAQRDAKTRFIAAASHDLRQPVQAAALYFDHALSDAEPRLRARAVAGAKRAFASVDALLDTMLDHLRLEAGAATARLEVIRMDSVFADVCDQLNALAEAAHIRLAVAGGDKHVVADGAMLRRVLVNVVGNAIRHSGARRVIVGARQSGVQVTLWVIDDGGGIDSLDVPRLFDDYVQGREGQGGPGGFGIGLASSRRMMRLMNGEIEFYADSRKGTAFRMMLPVARQVVRSEPEVQLCKAA